MLLFLFLVFFLNCFNNLLEFESLIDTSFNLKLSCCESKHSVKRAVGKLQEVFGGYDEYTISVIVFK